MNPAHLTLASVHAARMLRDRGYEVLELDLPILHAHPFPRTGIRGEEQIDVLHSPKFSLNDVRAIKQGSRVILVSDAELQEGALREVRLRPGLESFTVMELQVDPTHFAPHHQLLSHEERELYLKGSGLAAKQLPCLMLRRDRMVRHLGAEVGDIIRVTTLSETAGELVEYKVVV